MKAKTRYEIAWRELMMSIKRARRVVERGGGTLQVSIRMRRPA